jgi:transposase InsO family protein
VTSAWVEERRAEWPVTATCRVLDASRAGFYAWRSREPSGTEVRREGLTEQVKAIHAEAKARYGSPRVHAELAGRGHACCENAVARVVREAGIAAKTKRKFRRTTDSNHPHPVAENVPDREFDPGEPNASWVADATDVPTREGWLDLAVVVDPFGRMVVGWSMAATTTSRLVVDALDTALARCPRGVLGSGGPFGSREPVRERVRPAAIGRGRNRVRHEPPRKLLGRRADGELLRVTQEGVGS